MHGGCILVVLVCGRYIYWLFPRTMRKAYQRLFSSSQRPAAARILKHIPRVADRQLPTADVCCFWLLRVLFLALSDFRFRANTDALNVGTKKKSAEMAEMTDKGRTTAPRTFSTFQTPFFNLPQQQTWIASAPRKFKSLGPSSYS